MRYLFFLSLLFLFASCEVKVSTSASDKPEKTAPSNNRIRNGIAVEATGGVKVEQAFLTYVESGSFVNEDNATSINKPVKLNLVVKGWKAESGIVPLDAEQRISTNEGETVLDQKDMFAGVASISEKDAGVLSFQSVITRLNRIPDYFLVEVRAWNKSAAQEVKASFKLHIE